MFGNTICISLCESSSSLWWSVDLDGARPHWGLRQLRCAIIRYELAMPWTTYLARSCFMLQQGVYGADILYYYGDDANITGAHPLRGRGADGVFWQPARLIHRRILRHLVRIDPLPQRHFRDQLVPLVLARCREDVLTRGGHR